MIFLSPSQIRGANFGKFIKFLAEIKQGSVGGVKVRLDRLQALIPTSDVEHLEFEKDTDLDKLLHNELM